MATQILETRSPGDECSDLADVSKRSFNIELTGQITTVYDIALPRDAARERMRYATKRLLDRIVTTSDGARQGGSSSPLYDAQLGEAPSAVEGFARLAGELHLLREEKLCDDLSALSSRIRVEVEIIRKSEVLIAEKWAKAHAERKVRPFDHDLWFTTLVPPANDSCNKNRTASWNRIKAWSDEASRPLENM